MIHVANDTRQTQVFWYRVLDEDTGQLLGARPLTIPAGHQVVVGERWGEKNHRFFATQLERAGARDRSDLNGSTMKRHTGLLYSITRQIERDEILEGNAKVLDMAAKRAAEEATKAALGYDRVANSLSKRGGRRAARATEVEVEQLVAPNERASGNEMHFRLGVDTEGNQPVNLTIE